MARPSPDITALYTAILSLKTEDEAARFFRDLLTEPEIEDFAKRWKTVRMLDENRSYVDIEKETGLSSATIARISKWLNKGMGGYKLMLNRMHHYHLSPAGKRVR